MLTPTSDAARITWALAKLHETMIQLERRLIEDGILNPGFGEEVEVLAMAEALGWPAGVTCPSEAKGCAPGESIPRPGVAPRGLKGGEAAWRKWIVRHSGSDDLGGLRSVRQPVDDMIKQGINPGPSATWYDHARRACEAECVAEAELEEWIESGDDDETPPTEAAAPVAALICSTRFATATLRPERWSFGDKVGELVVSVRPRDLVLRLGTDAA
jgi:hypothetical protein